MSSDFCFNKDNSQANQNFLQIKRTREILDESEISTVNAEIRQKFKTLNVIQNNSFENYLTLINLEKNKKYNIIFYITHGSFPKSVNNAENVLFIKSFFPSKQLADSLSSLELIRKFFFNVVTGIHLEPSFTSDERQFLDCMSDKQMASIVSIENQFYFLVHVKFEKYFLGFNALASLFQCDFILVKLTDCDLFNIMLNLAELKGENIDEYLWSINTKDNITYKQLLKCYVKLQEDFKKYKHETQLFQLEFSKENKFLQEKINSLIKDINNYKYIVEQKTKSLTDLTIISFSFSLKSSPLENKDRGIILDGLEFQYDLTRSKSNDFEENLPKNDNSEKYDCIFCLENERDYLFPKCKHLVLCKDCIPKVKSAKKSNKYDCPLCQLSQEKPFQIYWG